ncbi:unnamed protein product [Cuscuta epithymum]|uniref:PRLI-interacting factor K n=1 Tax=Cuscuta epithymum TaxID=186058 RepID=A0AAV0FNE6_9ASTE|nr:unnamed protein product [Cuscuta epithymum]
MDFELRRAKEKLEREQKERKETARLKLERERKFKQEAIRQREAIEAAQRARRLDAAEAEAKANQQTEENLIAGRGIVFCRVLEAVPYHGSGDKIKLPSSCFTELSEQGAFEKGPLHFSLSVIHQNIPSNGNNETHAGVLEFTAEEGFTQLPTHIWTNLFPAEHATSPTIEVRYVWLPKGTYARLQPVETGFSDIPNHKAVLETSLRQHATLSEGDILTVTHGVLTYHLRVLELKPTSSVSVLDTDIEVDVIGADPTSNGTTSSQPILRPLTFGKPESGVIEEGNYTYYKFSLDEGTWERVSSGDAEIEVKIDSTAEDGDTDLYVSRHPLLFPTQHQHGWSSHDVGSKSLVLGSQGLGVGSYTIGVYGFKGTTKFSLSVAVQDKLKSKVGRQTSHVETMDTVECRNCKHFIPSRSIVLHEVYCARHNVVCQYVNCGIVLRKDEAENHVHCGKCGQAFKKEEMEKHAKVFHEPLACPCGVVLEKEKMMQHQSFECHLRLITCRFCGDMVQAGNSATVNARDRLRGLTEHESLCGSRTAPCDSCGRAVMLKDMDIHQIAVHQNN